MDAFCYIIHSQQLAKFYIGVTQDDVHNRLIQHNTASYGSNHFTARAKDWNLFLTIQVSTFDHAVRLERKIKAMKSTNYIRNLKKYPELKLKIITQTA